MGIKSILNNLAACQGCVGNLRNQISYPPLDASTAGTASVNPRQIDPVLLQYYEPLQKLGAGAVRSVRAFHVVANHLVTTGSPHVAHALQAGQLPLCSQARAPSPA